MIRQTVVKMFEQDGMLWETYTYDHPQSPQSKENLSLILSIHSSIHPLGWVESYTLRDKDDNNGLLVDNPNPPKGSLW